MAITRTEVESRLRTWIDPYLNKDWVSAKVIKRLDITDQGITLEVQLGYPFEGVREAYVTALKALFDKLSLTLTLRMAIEPHVGHKGMKGLPEIKNIIAVASGKGGVGKSTTAVNLALALSEEGASVGLLDADIYGPSQPLMLGINARPEINNDKKLMPIAVHGIQSISMGYLVDEKSPMVWRGPMVSMALQQLLHDTAWEALDYLIIDLPPGTGDIQLTMAQKIPVSGALIVTTPQELALLDARRAYEMFQKVNVPVLGIIENMSVHHCSACGHEEALFGEGGGARLAASYDVPLLGQLPLDKAIREETDGGKPTVIANPQSVYAKRYREIARKAAAVLSLQAKDYSSKFPSIVVK